MSGFPTAGLFCPRPMMLKSPLFRRPRVPINPKELPRSRLGFGDLLTSHYSPLSTFSGSFFAAVPSPVSWDGSPAKQNASEGLIVVSNFVYECFVAFSKAQVCSLTRATVAMNRTLSSRTDGAKPAKLKREVATLQKKLVTRSLQSS